MRRQILLASAMVQVIAMLTLNSCTSQSALGDKRNIGSGSDMYPSERLTDWVSYADQLSLVVVEGEEEIVPPKSVIDIGEGYIGRSALLRVVDTLWVQKDVSPVEGTISIPVAGWILRQGGKRSEAFVEGGPRIEVGDTFLIPLARQPDNSLGLLSSSAVLLVRDGAVTLADGQTNEAVKSLQGLTPEEVAERVRLASPDPLALEYWRLPPYERSRAVVNARAESPDQG